MSTLLTTFLVLHVVTGLIGIIAFYPVWTGLLRQRITVWSLRNWSLIGFISLLASWVTSWYYYVTYYGTSVKPIIKASKYPWAHTMFMEAKEHVFLFLPFLAVALLVVVWKEGWRLENEPGLKRALAVVAGLIVVIGIIVTLSGVIVSGAVRVK